MKKKHAWRIVVGNRPLWVWRVAFELSRSDVAPANDTGGA